ncbi:Autophagy-related protein [Dirofilaria immitis]
MLFADPCPFFLFEVHQYPLCASKHLRPLYVYEYIRSSPNWIASVNIIHSESPHTSYACPLTRSAEKLCLTNGLHLLRMRCIA